MTWRGIDVLLALHDPVVARPLAGGDKETRLPIDHPVGLVHDGEATVVFEGGVGTVS